MWRIKRPLLALGLAAFGLRAGSSLLTELNPIFPDYYYTDARLFHGAASAAVAELRAGRAPDLRGVLSERTQMALTTAVYWLFGPRPLAAKLLNAALGALAVALLARAFMFAFDERVSLAAGWLLALWPSHVFFTSQNLKEAPALALAAGALFAALRASERASAAWSAAAVLLMTAAGFYRSYILLVMAGTVLLICALERRRGSLFGAGAALLALALYVPASRAAVRAFDVRRPTGSPQDEIRMQASLLPRTVHDQDPGIVSRPTSPRGITNYRLVRQEADRRWARDNAGREIGTQIFPDARFESWGDVALYLPKGAFWVLFMPLPGLFPLQGSAGRAAAAAENLLLLALAGAAAFAAARGPKTPVRLGLLAFFAVMTAGAALLEFDLGSAGRHKLLYLPMLFPFAIECGGLLRRRA